MSSTLVGLKIRMARKGLGLTQGELARRSGISASYLNLIEQNRRPVGRALLERIAASLGVRRVTLDGEAEQRIVDEINEIAVDPEVVHRGGELGPAQEFVGRHPDWARLLLGVYRAYRERTHDVRALADRLNHDPFLGESVHRLLTKVSSIRAASEIVEIGEDLPAKDRARFLSIISSDGAELSRTAQALVDFFENADTRVRAATPSDHVDALLFNAQNHFPEIEQLAEDCVGAKGVAHLVKRVAPRGSRRPGGAGGVAGTPETWQFEVLRAYAARAGEKLVEAILERSGMPSDEAVRVLGAKALYAYAAAAMVMPYDRFYEAAEQHRYDPDALAQAFGVSYEQAAHRLTTLRRRGMEGPRFGFMRSDAAGFITKRLPLPQLPLPRYGHACPLWVVYGAFQTPGVTVRAFGEIATGEPFLFFARTIEKGVARVGHPRHLLSVMLVCAASEAPRVTAGDGLDRASGTVPLGTTCSLCARQGCVHRQQPRLAG